MEIEKESSKEPPLGILLLFPPVWSPVMPFLATPTLLGYLKAQGIRAQQRDVSIDFFMDYVLTEGFLLDTLEKVKKGCQLMKNLPNNLKKRMEDLFKNPKKYDKLLLDVERAKLILRDKETFFEIQELVNAQSALYHALELVSITTFPLNFTFNTLSNPLVKDFESLFIFFESENNIFKRFYELSLLDEIKKLSPILVGISISTSHQMLPGLTLAWLLKRHLKESTVILGGKQVDRLLDVFLREPNYSERLCDVVVFGDGELPLHGIFEWKRGSVKLEEVPNSTFFFGDRPKREGKVSYLPISERPFPDFEGIPFEKYLSPYPLLPIRLSEGCYWGKCTFCSRYDNRRYKTLDPDRAIDLIKELEKRYDTNFFMINDDCLTPVYLEKLAKRILRDGLRLNISLWAKPVKGFTKERLKLLFDAGVKLIRWGIETGNARVLKLMNKGTNLKDSLKTLKDSAEVGIWNHGMFILGFPTETEEEGRETVKFLEFNYDKIHSAIFFKFSLLKHSHIFNHKEIYSITEIKNSENIFSYEYEFFSSKGMDKRALDDIFSWAQKYRINEIYTHPTWFYMRIREYILLYLSKFPLQHVQRLKVDPDTLRVYMAGTHLKFNFLKGEELDEQLLERLRAFISGSEEVGRSWIGDNLRNALWIAYVEEGEKIVATMVHKRPKEKYLNYLREKTGLDLRGYVERGYSFVRPEYRGLGIGDRMLKGLVKRTPDTPVYVTIRLDNLPAIRLTEKNQMKLVASYLNERTGHEVGIFINGTIQNKTSA